jgi:hypothetical protein
VVSFPLLTLEHAAASSLDQLLSFSVAGAQDAGAISALLDHVDMGSGFRQAALKSLQARDALPVAAADLMTKLGLLFALAATGALLALGMRRRIGALLVTVLAGVLANAAVCGTLSVVDGRYQARVVWLVAFVGLLAASEVWTLLSRRSRALLPAHSASSD